MTDNPFQTGPLLAPAGTPSEPTISRLGSRKKASTACSACRARRSKCTGGIPCLSCVSHRTECVKDESEDGRRRVAVKRKLEALEIDRYILDNLVAALKHGSQSKINSLIHLVRTNTSRQDLRDFLDDALRDGEFSTRQTVEQQQRNSDDSFDALQPRGRRRTGGIGDLINPPLQVPAKPWTGVTDDDDFVSHLISLWFTWIHPCLRWVEEEEFIEAMQAQDLKSPFCTPYLVNSILAEACLLDVSDAKESSYHTQLRDRFLAEARSGMDAEQGRISLALVQATGVQWTDLYLNGQDRMGRIVVNTHIYMAQGLDKWKAEQAADSQSSLLNRDRIEKCIINVRWTHYALNSFNLADHHSQHEFPGPEDGASGMDHDSTQASPWASYPLHRSFNVDFHADCHFRALVSLSHKMAENEAISRLRERGLYEGDKLEKLGQVLQDWPSSLPPCMHLDPQSMPHTLTLHALYNWVLLVLAKQAAAAQAGRPSNPIITATPASHNGRYWQGMALSKAVAIADILENYKRNWGTEYCPPLVLQPLSIALLTLLEDLEDAENQAAFITLSKFLRAISRKLRVGRGVIQVIRNTVRDQRINIPAEAEQALEGHERQMTDNEASSDVSSRKSDYASPGKDMTVDYLLEKWGDLNLKVKGDDE